MGDHGDSSTDPAKEFVEYMFGDGYIPWIGIAPEGKLPGPAGHAPTARRSTPTSGRPCPPAWTRKAPLSDFYARRCSTC